MINTEFLFARKTYATIYDNNILKSVIFIDFVDIHVFGNTNDATKWNKSYSIHTNLVYTMYNAHMTVKTSNIEDQIWNKLEDVIDPELYISIVDLGLVYKVTNKNGDVMIRMTLTTIGCPLLPIIEKDIQTKLLEIDGIKNVSIDLVFDPPWDIERMSEKGKAMMGI